MNHIRRLDQALKMKDQTIQSKNVLVSVKSYILEHNLKAKRAKDVMEQ